MLSTCCRRLVRNAETVETGKSANDTPWIRRKGNCPGCGREVEKKYYDQSYKTPPSLRVKSGKGG